MASNRTVRMHQKRIFQSFCVIALAVLGVQVSSVELFDSEETRQIKSQTPNHLNRPVNSASSSNTQKQVLDATQNSSEKIWIQGRVVKVSDGDTIQVLVLNRNKPETIKVRLVGVDAPEKRQAFGEKARQFLAKQVAGKEVSLEVFGKDRYGRMLGRILMGSVDVNAVLLSQGFAWYYKQFEKELPESLREVYSDAEFIAKSQSRGLWIDLRPKAPWDFRGDLRGTSYKNISRSNAKNVEKLVNRKITNQKTLTKETLNEEALNQE